MVSVLNKKKKELPPVLLTLHLSHLSWLSFHKRKVHSFCLQYNKKEMGEIHDECICIRRKKKITWQIKTKAFQNIYCEKIKSMSKEEGLKL